MFIYVNMKKNERKYLEVLLYLGLVTLFVGFSAK